MLRTKWASLSKRIPPVEDLVGVPELIAGFSTAFPSFRTEEPNLIRITITEEL